MHAQILRSKKINGDQKQEIISDLASGISQREIARRLGCHYNTIWKFAKRPQVIQEIRQLRSDFKKIVRERLL